MNRLTFVLKCQPKKAWSFRVIPWNQTQQKYGLKQEILQT